MNGRGTREANTIPPNSWREVPTTRVSIERSTFLIDDSGKLVREWRKVKVEGHAEEVLAAVKAL